VHADVDAAVAAAIHAEGAPEFSDAALKQRCGELFSGLPALLALERSGAWEPGRAGHLSSISVGPRSSG
jgi:hypothetical protein